MLKAYWWNPTKNFGDMLSPIILRFMSGREIVWTPRVVGGKVLAIGSILGALKKGDVVWGAGAIRDAPIVPPEGVKFLAVRGPLTRGLIYGSDVPETYGDPALLLPKFYRADSSLLRYAIGVMPHEIDKDVMTVDDPAVRMIDANAGPLRIIDELASCDIVISSSLHGLIVAEAYGRPAVWVRASDRIIGGNFKFNDYFLSTDRDRREPLPWQPGIWKLDMKILPTPRINTAALEAAFYGHFGPRKED